MNRHLGFLALASVLLAACERDAPVAPLRPTGPLMEIDDASRNAARAHFYFLPPMAAKPAYAGTFDPSVLPHVAVEVSECSGADGCATQVARFTAEGRKLERVSTSEHFEHYLAIWPTHGPEVSAGKTYRVVVLAAGTALGHADVKVVRTLTEARSVDRTQYAVALKPLPLLIRFRIEAGGVFVIGPSGGSVNAVDGAVQLSFPADAVSAAIGVTVVPASGLPADARAIPGTAFDFGPDGAQFGQPVRLSIRYDPTALPAGVDEGSLRLHKLTDGAWVEVPASAVDVDANAVTGDINGFSVYGVSALPPRPDPGALGQIAFVRDGDIWLINADGTNPRNLTNQQADYRDLTWAPAGDKLAFASDRNGNYEVYVMGAEGTPVINVSERSEANQYPNWAPAASLGDLFFTGNPSCPGGGDYAGILVGRSGGGAAQELPQPTQIQSSDPCKFGNHGVKGGLAVSVDGAHVAYRSSIGPDGYYFVVSSAVTGQIVAYLRKHGDPAVIDFPRIPTDGDVSSGFFDVREFAWSPKDANRLAVAINADAFAADLSGLYIADLATGSATRVVDERYWIAGLAWSPNGDKIAFVGCRRDVPCDYNSIFVVDLGGAIDDLTVGLGKNVGESISWSPAGDKIAFSAWGFIGPEQPERDRIYVVSVAQPGAFTPLTNGQTYDSQPRWRP